MSWATGTGMSTHPSVASLVSNAAVTVTHSGALITLFNRPFKHYSPSHSLAYRGMKIRQEVSGAEGILFRLTVISDSGIASLSLGVATLKLSQRQKRARY